MTPVYQPEPESATHYPRERLQRVNYETSVLKELTVVGMKLDQNLTYQKTCDAERAAHAARLTPVENDIDKIKTILGTIVENQKEDRKDIDTLQQESIRSKAYTRAQTTLISVVFSAVTTAIGLFLESKH